ncbi:hypothetical protein [Pasteuria penetrans]|uniref:hypothetical protein n=1 Tax=Pasteuria penetrans TaxID=86005 RepID=UPI000F9444A3|nr:hypothetical protein [Pasteuria penetrans]
MSREHMYQSVARSVNGIIGRPVVTVSALQTLSQECLHVRRTYGQLELMRFAQGIPSRFMSPAEIEKLQYDVRFPEIANNVIRIAMGEGIINTREARMLQKMLTSHTGKKANGKRRMRW